MFKTIAIASLAFSTISANAQEIMTCTSKRISVEFQMRDNQPSDNFGLIKDSFRAREIVGYEDDGQRIYGDEELRVGMAYYMRLEENGGKFNFVGNVFYPEDTYPVFHFEALQRGDNANTLDGQFKVLAPNDNTPWFSYSDMTCVLTSGLPD